MSLRSMWLVGLLTISMSVISAEQMVGVNIAGAEFNGAKLPGRHFFDYIWPSPEEIKRFSDAGFTVIRVPFLWERMQPELSGPLNTTELQNLDKAVEAAKNNNISIILDPHNYGKYRGNLIGTEAVSVVQFQDFWKKLADRYKSYPNVIFGLMNEPNKQTTEEWATQAQAAIDAIRSTNAKQLILVPGTKWTGAHSWLNAGINPSNADALKSVTDPLNNFAFDMHQYFDYDSSGTHPSCVSEDIGAQRLEKATKWLNETGHHAFLGEFGASSDPVCMKALENTLTYLRQNQNVWIGWSYWAGGKWWGNYMFNIQSLDPDKAPQYAVINKFLLR